MENLQDIAAIKFVLTLSGAIIGILLAIVGFFLARIVSDVKSNSEGIGKNKGTIELVKQQQESDIKRIEETTQLELKQLTKEVSGLTKSVQTLVEVQMKK
jgi:hypothetical protein